MDAEVEEWPGREHMDMAPHNEVRQTWLPGCFSLQDAYAEDHKVWLSFVITPSC